MTAPDLAGIVAAYLFAAFVKGTTGLGFSTTCLPFLVLIVGLKDALALIVLPSLASNLMVMIDAGGARAAWRRFWPMFVATVPGIAIGLALLVAVDGDAAAGALGAVLIVYALYAFARPGLRLPDRYAQPLAPAVGLATGLVNGLTGSQLIPVLPYLLALHLERNLFVQTINWSFTLSSLALAVGLSRIGLFDTMSLLVSFGGIACVSLGVSAGGRLRRWLPESAFRAAVLCLLIALGLTLIARASGASPAVLG